MGSRDQKHLHQVLGAGSFASFSSALKGNIDNSRSAHASSGDTSCDDNNSEDKNVLVMC